MTVSVAILMSGVVSLMLTPMMCAWMLRPAERGRRRAASPRGSRPAFQRSLDVYAVALRWSLRHRVFMLVVMAATMAATAWLYIVIPKGFFPQQDNGTIQGTSEAAQDISYTAMVERVHELAKVVMADPDVDTVYYWVGANPTVNTGRLMIDLKPLAERKATATEVIDRLRRATARRCPASRCSGRRARTCRSARGSARRNTSTRCRIPMSRSCSNGRPIVLEKLATLPQLQDVTGDLQATAPRMMLKIDRDAIGRFGVTPQPIDDTLYDAFGQRQVATVFGQLDQRRVILEVAPSFQEDASIAAEALRPIDHDRTMVPLSALTRPEMSVSPLTINHTDQFPSVTLSFNLAPDIRSAMRSSPFRTWSARSPSRRRSRPVSRARPRCSRPRSRPSPT